MEPEWIHLPQAQVIKHDYLKWLQQLQGGGENWGSLFFGAYSSQKINIYLWKCVGKELGENGMNEACEMEMIITRSWAVLRCMLAMKAKWSVVGLRYETQPQRNGDGMERIYRKHK